MSPDHLDMSRWSESRQLPRNFLVTSWRLSRNICYGEVTGKLVPVEFELYTAGSDKSDTIEGVPDQLLKGVAMVFRVHSRHFELLLTY